MAISLITNGQGSGNTNPTTGALDTTGATLLIAVVTYAGTVSVSDSKGNTWTALTASANGGVTSRIYYVNSATPTVGSGHTFTLNGTGIAGAINIIAFSGSDSTPYDGQQNANSAASGATLTTNSVTPTANNYLVVAGFSGGNTFGGAGSINLSFNITNQKALTGGSNYGTAAAYLIQGTAAAVNPTWTLGSTVSNIASSIAVFQGAPASTFTATPLMHHMAISGGLM